ncbi:alpha/beta hydrolase [Fictibacillus sp. Mic-4]|uniref:alpha/beta hydrolase n=1 Tax=Fictibacillus sp. Mic-4 TaxID=3132826 RepID=UPI003CF8B15F
MKKRIWRVLLIFFVLIVIADIGASFYFYNVAVSRSDKRFLNDDPGLNHVPAVKEINWLEEMPLKDVSIESDDGLKLHGYYLKAKSPTRKTVIIAHGYNGEAKEMGPYAQFYYEKLGYNVLLPDARGHGRSEGNYIGFGWKERKDYVKWIRYVIQKVGDDSEIVLHGVSMGGATVSMASGENLPKNVKAIVSDCAYTSVDDELSYQMKRMYHLPPIPLVQSTSLLTKIRAGYSFEEASALEQVKKSHTPMLFIHGDADVFVPFKMVYELYNACGSEKELYVVHGAGHGMSHKVDPVGYEKKVTNFLSKYVQ